MSSPTSTNKPNIKITADVILTAIKATLEVDVVAELIFLHSHFAVEYSLHVKWW